MGLQFRDPATARSVHRAIESLEVWSISPLQPTKKPMKKTPIIFSAKFFTPIIPALKLDDIIRDSPEDLLSVLALRLFNKRLYCYEDIAVRQDSFESPSFGKPPSKGLHLPREGRSPAQGAPLAPHGSQESGNLFITVRPRTWAVNNRAGAGAHPRQFQAGSPAPGA